MGSGSELSEARGWVEASPWQEAAAGGVAATAGSEGDQEEGFPLPDRFPASPSDCEPPLKKEGSLPEGPVLEALLCAETGDKKPELKEEELVLDCPVRKRKEWGSPPAPQMRGKSWRSACGSPPSAPASAWGSLAGELPCSECPAG